MPNGPILILNVTGAFDIILPGKMRQFYTKQ